MWLHRMSVLIAFDSGESIQGENHGPLCAFLVSLIKEFKDRFKWKHQDILLEFRRKTVGWASSKTLAISQRKMEERREKPCYSSWHENHLGKEEALEKE